MADTNTLSLRELELELHRRKMEDPLALVYKPHERQQEVHRTRAPITGLLGGNRSGKTWSAVAECLMYATGRSTWAEVPEPPLTIWYVMPSMGMFFRVIEPIFNQLCPKSELLKFPKQPYVTAQFKNGSKIHFLSADMTQKRLQGAAVHLVVMDEDPHERVYNEMIARVTSTRGRIILVLAPVDAASFWIRDQLYIPWQAGDRQDIHFIHMPTADKEGHSLVPHLTDEDIADMERKYPDPAVRAARIYGEFVTRSGIVFQNFEVDVHVVPAFDVPDEYARWWVVDPQYHRFAALYFAADHEGNVFATDEYFSKDENLAHRATRMAAITGNPEKPLPVYCDSANPQDAAELNWHFARIGAPLAAHKLPFQKKVDQMLLRVQSLLEPDDDRQYPKITGLVDEDGEPFYGAPRLFFFDRLLSSWVRDGRDMHCSRLLWELQRLSWGKNGKPDKESAAGSDMCDCFDAETEVLTADGWKYFADVEVGQDGDSFATINLDKDQLEYQKGSHKIDKPYSGEMVQLKGHRIDILVTPRHRMVLLPKDKPGERNKHEKVVVRAEELTKSHRLKLTTHWKGKKRRKAVLPETRQRAGGRIKGGKLIQPKAELSPGDWAEFLGWYVAEGSRSSTRSRTQGNRRYIVTISQRAGEKKDRLVSLCERLPWKFRVYDDGLWFSSKQLFLAVGRCGDGVANKRVPKWVKESDPETIERFLCGAIAGDGWVTRSNTREHRHYATISAVLADDIQELFLKVGNSANVKRVSPKTWSIEGRSGFCKDQYHVSECYTPGAHLTRSLRPEETGLRPFIGERVQYVGKVYCVTVPNGTLVCRRNGRMFIAGNCLVYGCSILSAGIKLEEADVWMKNMPVADQVIWRAMEHQDKQRAAYVREL